MEEFLARRHVAALGTHNRHGSIQPSAVWYLHEGDSIYAATTAGTVKTVAFGGVFETPGYMLPPG